MIWLFLIGAASSFYLPGLAPVGYCKVGEESEECRSKIDLFVNRLTSTDSVIPFEYAAFDFCTADSSKKSPTENLGQVLFGEVRELLSDCGARSLITFCSVSALPHTTSYSPKAASVKKCARRNTKRLMIRSSSSNTA